MAVKLRLARIGKKNAPVYRIVAIDSRRKRDGKFLEEIGTYNPLNNTVVQFHTDRYQNWITKGAIPTDSVKKIEKMHKQAQQTAPAA